MAKSNLISEQEMNALMCISKDIFEKGPFFKSYKYKPNSKIYIVSQDSLEQLENLLARIQMSIMNGKSSQILELVLTAKTIIIELQ
jgi:hypothetical protein